MQKEEKHKEKAWLVGSVSAIIPGIRFSCGSNDPHFYKVKYANHDRFKAIDQEYFIGAPVPEPNAGHWQQIYRYQIIIWLC